MYFQDRAISVLQITDCHLSADPSKDLLGINTLESLQAVLDDVNASGQKPDLVLVTGDISQDGSVEAYQKMNALLAGFDCPIRWFAGNHDHRENMLSVVGSSQFLDGVTDCGAWKVIMLDSLSPGNVHGELSNKELSVLEETLASLSSDTHALVCLHHHPVDVGAAWLDRIGLHNRDAFWEIINRFPNVKSLLWGHIHQEFDVLQGDVRMLASPSTCIQFKRNSDGFALDELAPGYRWLGLNTDGSVDTQVVRVDDYSFELDLSSNGY